MGRAITNGRGLVHQLLKGQHLLLNSFLGGFKLLCFFGQHSQPLRRLLLPRLLTPQFSYLVSKSGGLHLLLGQVFVGRKERGFNFFQFRCRGHQQIPFMAEAIHIALGDLGRVVRPATSLPGANLQAVIGLQPQDFTEYRLTF